MTEQPLTVPEPSTEPNEDEQPDCPGSEDEDKEASE